MASQFKLFTAKSQKGKNPNAAERQKQRWNGAVAEAENWMNLEAVDVLDVKCHVTQAKSRLVIAVLWRPSAVSPRAEKGRYTLTIGMGGNSRNETWSRTRDVAAGELAQMVRGEFAPGGVRPNGDMISCSFSQAAHKKDEAAKNVRLICTGEPRRRRGQGDIQFELGEALGNRWDHALAEAQLKVQKITEEGGTVVDVDMLATNPHVYNSPTSQIMIAYTAASPHYRGGPTTPVTLSWIENSSGERPRGQDKGYKPAFTLWEKELPLLASACEQLGDRFIATAFAPDQCDKGGPAWMLVASYDFAPPVAPFEPDTHPLAGLRSSSPSSKPARRFASPGYDSRMVHQKAKKGEMLVFSGTISAGELARTLPNSLVATPRGRSERRDHGEAVSPRRARGTSFYHGGETVGASSRGSRAQSPYAAPRESPARPGGPPPRAGSPFNRTASVASAWAQVDSQGRTGVGGRNPGDEYSMSHTAYSRLLVPEPEPEPEPAYEIGGSASVRELLNQSRSSAMNMPPQGVEELDRIARNTSVAGSSRVGKTRGFHKVHYAAYAGDPEGLLVLIRDGAAIDRRDNKKNTPLHVACECGHLNVVNMLLKTGFTNPNCVNARAETPLHAVGHKRPPPPIVSRDAADRLLGFQAASHGHMHVVRRLMDPKPMNERYETAKSSMQDVDGSPPAQLATARHFHDVAAFLNGDSWDPTADPSLYQRTAFPDSDDDDELVLSDAEALGAQLSRHFADTTVSDTRFSPPPASPVARTASPAGSSKQRAGPGRTKSGGLMMAQQLLAAHKGAAAAGLVVNSEEGENPSNPHRNIFVWTSLTDCLCFQVSRPRLSVVRSFPRLLIAAQIRSSGWPGASRRRSLGLLWQR